VAQQQKPDHPKRKLKIVGQSEKASGIGKNDKPWTLYDYDVEKEDGSKVELQCKGFRDLSDSFGKLIEFGVEKQTHEKYGDSYLLHPPKRDLKVAVDELRNRVQTLEHEVSTLKGMIGSAPAPTPTEAPAARGPSDPPPSSGSESPARGPAVAGASRSSTDKPSAEERFGGDDDIPF
jgi:hypothetical protein